jgi:hypothetical protein
MVKLKKGVKLPLINIFCAKNIKLLSTSAATAAIVSATVVSATVVFHSTILLEVY